MLLDALDAESLSRALPFDDVSGPKKTVEKTQSVLQSTDLPDHAAVRRPHLSEVVFASS